MESDCNNLHWHALNYRTAATQHANEMWQELAAFVERQNAVDAKDAARYRWLIEGDNAWRVLRVGPCDPTEFVAIGPGLEHAIDAAMRQDACTPPETVDNADNV